MGDYAASRILGLEQRGFSPEQVMSERTHVSVSEKGKTYRVAVRKGMLSVVYQVDGQEDNPI